MRFVPPHDQTLAAAFKAAAIIFLTAWLIPGKRVCKAGTSQGEARIRLVPNSRLVGLHPGLSGLVGTSRTQPPSLAYLLIEVVLNPMGDGDARDRPATMDKVVLDGFPVGKRILRLIGNV